MKDWNLEGPQARAKWKRWPKFKFWLFSEFKLKYKYNYYKTKIFNTVLFVAAFGTIISLCSKIIQRN